MLSAGEMSKKPNININKPESTEELHGHLVKAGLISQDQLDIGLKIYQESPNKKALAQILVELGFITESALKDVLSGQKGIKDFDLKSARLDANVINIIPKDVALADKAIAVSLAGDRLYVAITDIYDIVLVDKLNRYCPKGCKVIPLHAFEADIVEAIDRYYGYEMSVEGILKEMEELGKEAESLASNIDEYTNPTVRLVDSIISDAFKKGASDIHFEPEESFLRLRYRIDGMLIQVCSFHKDYWNSVAVRVKILAGMNIAEKRHPQDGRISYNQSGQAIDLRVATQPTIHGENIVIRILDKKKSLIPLEDLGLTEHNYSTLKKMLMKPEGIIVVTGPTGSGKTTTLYSILNHINSLEVNIMTMEDPVEYSLPVIRQSDARTAGSSFSFDEGIKSLLRQDPDIIFIGEIRDEKAANLAIRASMTGHKVFTTIHANDAAGIIPRIVNIGIDPKMLASALIGVISQRLVRKLCRHCREEYVCSEEECKILGIKSPVKIFRKVGCHHCLDIGYSGRVVICEILGIDEDLAELISTGASAKAIRKCAVEKGGFVPMLESGIQKVLSGVIDIPELGRVADITDRL
ncbi:type II secretion system protein E [Rickettsiales bacterium]|nr:type II secretion system protein E [Rickettsiales bacterium]